AGESCVSGCDGAVALTAPEGPLAGVALLVGLAVERRGSASCPAFRGPVPAVVLLLGDHRLDAALAQVAAVRLARVGLVGQDTARALSWPAGSWPGHADAVGHRLEPWRGAALGCGGLECHGRRAGIGGREGV